MSEKTAAPLILTLKFDEQTFEFFDRLRKQYFPPHRNFIPAHVTLFHALPGAQEARICEQLEAVCNETPILDLNFPHLRFLGKGVAAEVESQKLILLRNALASEWRDSLQAQDRQKYKHPHVTIQNKVLPDKARETFNQLSRTWQPFAGRGEALLLWRYLGGPWEAAGEFALKNTESSN